jgi:hypothetical protein
VTSGESVTADIAMEPESENDLRESAESSGWCFISSLGMGRDEGEKAAPMALGFVGALLALAVTLQTREKKSR